VFSIPSSQLIKHMFGPNEAIDAGYR